MHAAVIVFPVPGGPYIKHNGESKAFLTAIYWEKFNSGKLGAENYYGNSTSISIIASQHPRIVS